MLSEFHAQPKDAQAGPFPSLAWSLRRPAISMTALGNDQPGQLAVFFLSHVVPADLRVGSILRMVLDTVKSSEAMWDWGQLPLSVPDQEPHQTRNGRVGVLESLSQLCLRRPQVKPENQVSPNYRKKKKNENQRGRMTCPVSQPVCDQTPVPKLPDSAFTLH